MALTNKQAYDITNMNVAAQKANLGQLINDIIAKAGTKLTDKQVYDLTHMNVAAQDANLGKLLKQLLLIMVYH